MFRKIIQKNDEINNYKKANDISFPITFFFNLDLIQKIVLIPNYFSVVLWQELKVRLNSLYLYHLPFHLQYLQAQLKVLTHQLLACHNFYSLYLELHLFAQTETKNMSIYFFKCEQRKID
ncbi:hypothetical protein BpHYR1_032940 [Brachionus plicatilis]|uniref:Uncharacterized protein n=1 Tax=Brachionus plicatilis TaxID=10195 RepID=A0A3M7RQ73_BRAPC|nr:hypothetical protein BpHYR1_032940 [Brachionus plicatilis]